MSAPGPEAVPAVGGPPRPVVLITGPGRSGTSTMAGALKILGLRIPQPEVAADATNPRGFFEPRWVVDLHKRLLTEAGVRTMDARPRAWRPAAKVGARPAVRAELRDWLASQPLDDRPTVVKDPRTFWFHELWREELARVGATPVFVTMVRHPTEVVGSRREHYRTDVREERKLVRQTGHLAGWVNGVLLTERITRGELRCFVDYADLLGDARATLARVAATTTLPIGDPDHHGAELDEFIDPSLHRVRVGWDDVEVPGPLRDLAEDTWTALAELREADTPQLEATFDALGERYRDMFDAAVALVEDRTHAQLRAQRQRLTEGSPPPGRLARVRAALRGRRA